MSASVASVKMKHVHFEQVEANLKGEPKLCACSHSVEKVQLYTSLSGVGSSINIILTFNDLICDDCRFICPNHPHYTDCIAQSCFTHITMATTAMQAQCVFLDRLLKLASR